MPADPAIAKALFLEAAAIDDPAARTAKVAERCGEDSELRARVQALLAANDKVLAEAGTGSFGGDAGTRSFGGDEPTADYPGRDEVAGAVLGGRYALVEPIGEGGMGAVWRAKQTEPVKRFVAVKLIKAGMDSRQVLARFEAERQALALMDHPNIAKVLDGGLHDGRPYFVMELVKGVPVTEYCDTHKLPPNDRLGLFVQACQAIQHAHQKGIIHRDIKPSNVLVALYDDKPVVKVIDFGVAKATGGTLTEHTLDTGFGGVVGTPQYMSPEQATFNNLDIDTRSDVYALGVLLYELLAGSPPFSGAELKKKGLLEILRVVREEEPPRPSTKLSTADALPTLSANRGTEPKKLTGLLRNELDWIVMKALEKDRARRYETANGFAADVLRYLAGEAVLAHPPSAAYRVKKFVRRNTGQVLAASLVFVALVAGVIGTTLGLLEARRQTEFAREQEAEAKKQEGIARGETTAKEAAREEEARQRATAVAEKKKAIEFRDQALDALRATTSEDVEKLIGSKQELTANEKEYLESIAKRWLAFARQEATDEQSQAIRAEGHFRVAYLWCKIGRLNEALPHYELALTFRAKLAADFPTVPAYRRDLALSHNNLGILLEGQGKRAEAEEHFHKGLALLEKLAADFPAVPVYRHDLAASHHNLGSLLTHLGKRVAAEEQRRKGLALQEKLAADFPTVPQSRRNLALSHNNLGILLEGQGKRAEAEEHFHKGLALQEKLAADFPAEPDYRQELALSHTTLGALLAGQGKRAEAEKLHRKGLAIKLKLAADFPSVPAYRRDLALSHNNLGIVLAGQGKQAEAEEQYRQGLVINEKLTADFSTVPEYRLELARNHHNLGNLLAGLGMLAAVEHFHKGLAIQEKLAADFPAEPGYRQVLAHGHHSLGNLLAGQGKRAEAQEQYRKGLALREKLAADFPAAPIHRQQLAQSYHDLGVLLEGLGKRTEAQEQYRLGQAIREKLVAEFPAIPDHRLDLAISHNSLGVLLEGLGKRLEAQEQHRRGQAVSEKLVAEFPAVPDYQVLLGASYCNVGILVRNSGKPAESLAWYQKAIDTLRPVCEENPSNVRAKQCLRGSYCNRALSHNKLRNYAEAMKDWDRALGLSEKSQQPQIWAACADSKLRAGLVAEAVAEVAELRKLPGWSAGQLYNFACVYGVASGKVADKKQEYADTAMEILAMAVKAGYAYAEHMKTDTDLDPLRDRADFKTLMVELEAKLPPPREQAPPPRAVE